MVFYKSWPWQFNTARSGMATLNQFTIPAYTEYSMSDHNYFIMLYPVAYPWGSHFTCNYLGTPPKCSHTTPLIGAFMKWGGGWIKDIVEGNSFIMCAEIFCWSCVNHAHFHSRLPGSCYDDSERICTLVIYSHIKNHWYMIFLLEGITFLTFAKRRPMDSAPYIGPRLGDGPTFEVAVRLKRAPR